MNLDFLPQILTLPATPFQNPPPPPPSKPNTQFQVKFHSLNKMTLTAFLSLCPRLHFQTNLVLRRGGDDVPAEALHRHATVGTLHQPLQCVRVSWRGLRRPVRVLRQKQGEPYLKTLYQYMHFSGRIMARPCDRSCVAIWSPIHATILVIY